MPLKAESMTEEVPFKATHRCVTLVQVCCQGSLHAENGEKRDLKFVGFIQL